MQDDFDFDAYYIDTRRLSLDARGAWMDCLCQMRLETPRGRISEPVSVYATMFGSTIQKAQRVIDEIADRRVADRIDEANGNVTLINRRMFRKWQEQDAMKIRQRNYRAQAVTAKNGNKDGPDAVCHGSVTDLSQNALLVEEGITNGNSQKKKQRRLVSSSRIPDPFPLTPEMEAWALLNCPHLKVKSAHESFVEYWTNNTTAKSYKVDWMLTWRKGMKLALKWQTENQTRGVIGKHTAPPQQYKCEECHDLGEVTVPDPDGEYSFSVKEIPCPQCRRAA